MRFPEARPKVSSRARIRRVLNPGLCSITFRQLDAEEVLHVAAEAGLTTVEWGGDVHVPVGDTETARVVAARTADAGLRVASYGSYWRADEDFGPVLETAVALGAPRVRVWAGHEGSAAATDRRPVVRALAGAVRRGTEAGVQIGTESHGGTLTDTTASTLLLLQEVDQLVGAQSLTTYWQPTVDALDDEALAELAVLLGRVSTVHAFSWGPGTHRNRLASRAALWTRVVDVLTGSATDHDVLLEFIPGDDPLLLGDEAKTLRDWLKG
jgi:3-dehydroshikimate dehydratase